MYTQRPPRTERPAKTTAATCEGNHHVQAHRHPGTRRSRHRRGRRHRVRHLGPRRDARQADDLQWAARFTPTSTGGVTLTFNATVAAKSGVQNLKVLAWPAGSHLAPTAHEMTQVDDATCKATSPTTATCTYAEKSSAKEAAALPKGTWYVSALATTKDHHTTFAPKAAHFTVNH
ncbi:DUF5707 domain-containing protein [Streptomyces sp. NPDC048106]|uniref:DUF5707 domain-containing protein n=1 Tax=Streptomyces sp. NPDC048106 TaxID=3155750 RepID=UPI003455D561